MPTYRFEKLSLRLLLHAGHDAVEEVAADDSSSHAVVMSAGLTAAEPTAGHGHGEQGHGGQGYADVAHPDDHVRQGEHAALLDLVPHDQATHVVVADGAWSDPATWRDGQLPGDGSRVLVPVGRELLLDGEFASRVATLRVDGLLRFATDTDTRLLVDTLVVAPGGRLEIGTEAAPIAPEVTATIIFTDDGAIDTRWDPTLLSRGLLSHGSASIHGAEKTGPVELTRAPQQGDTQLLLAEPVEGWRVGDRVLVPGVVKPVENNRGRTLVDQDELVVITGVSADGRTIDFDTPLAHDHVPPRGELLLPVANLDRNIVFTSENADTPSRAGHVMFLHSADVSVEGAAFRGLGRNDKSLPTTDPQLNANGELIRATGRNARGRYSLHFHRIGSDSTPVHVRGSVVEDSPGWGFVNHDSHVVMTGNVSYNVKGAGFVAEVGSERGAFIDNLAVRSTGRNFYAPLRGTDKDGFEGFGSAGHGFWLQSSQVALIGNTAAGHAQEGIFIHNRSVVEPGRDEASFASLTDVAPGTPLDFDAGEEETTLRGDLIRPDEAPLAEVRGNQVFASGAGIGVRWRRPTSARVEGSDGDVIEDFKIWNVEWAGVHLGYTTNLTLRNGLILGDLDDPISLNGREANNRETETAEFTEASGKGVAANRNSRNLTYENLEIGGFTVGIQALTQSETVIDSVRLQNVENLVVVTPQATSQSGGVRRVLASNVENVPLTAAALGNQTAYNVRLVKQIDRLGVAGGSSAGNEFQSFTDSDGVYYNGHRLYFYDQAADAVPFPRAEAPRFLKRPDYSRYLNLTNSELEQRFGVAFGGEVAPAEAFDARGSLGANALAVEVEAAPGPAERVQFRYQASATDPVWVFGEAGPNLGWETTALPSNTSWRVYLVGEQGVQEIARSGLPAAYGSVDGGPADDGWTPWNLDWPTVGELPPWWQSGEIASGAYSLVATAAGGPAVFLGRVNLMTAAEAAAAAMLADHDSPHGGGASHGVSGHTASHAHNAGPAHHTALAHVARPARQQAFDAAFEASETAAAASLTPGTAHAEAAIEELDAAIGDPLATGVALTREP